MHVTFMFILNEGVTSWFVIVYIMDNMNLWRKINKLLKKEEKVKRSYLADKSKINVPTAYILIFVLLCDMGLQDQSEILE